MSKYFIVHCNVKSTFIYLVLLETIIFNFFDNNERYLRHSSYQNEFINDQRELMRCEDENESCFEILNPDSRNYFVMSRIILKQVSSEFVLRRAQLGLVQRLEINRRSWGRYVFHFKYLLRKSFIILIVKEPYEERHCRSLCFRAFFFSLVWLSLALQNRSTLRQLVRWYEPGIIEFYARSETSKRRLRCWCGVGGGGGGGSGSGKDERCLVKRPNGRTNDSEVLARRSSPT
jgi:hypothetical protein